MPMRVERDDQGNPYRWVIVAPDKVVVALKQGDKAVVESLWTGGNTASIDRLNSNVASLFEGTPFIRLLANAQSIREVKRWIKENHLEEEADNWVHASM